MNCDSAASRRLARHKDSGTETAGTSHEKERVHVPLQPHIPSGENTLGAEGIIVLRVAPASRATMQGVVIRRARCCSHGIICPTAHHHSRPLATGPMILWPNASVNGLSLRITKGGCARTRLVLAAAWARNGAQGVLARGQSHSRRYQTRAGHARSFYNPGRRAGREGLPQQRA